MLAALILTAPDGATAGTATDLKCKGCVGKTDLGRKAVTNKAIRKNTVTSKHIRNGSITSADIANGTINPVDLATSARPTGADHTETRSVYGLTGTLSEVISTTVTAPTDGFVVAIANWYYYATAGDSWGVCSLATAAGVADGPEGDGLSDSADTYYLSGTGLNRMFPVSAGDTTIHLNCRGQSSMDVREPQITAFFVPNRY